MAETASTDQSAPSSNSPITQLLVSLGMTREDLNRHSAQMREFLTTENANSLRALAQTNDKPQSTQLSQQSHRLVSIAPAPVKSHSRASAAATGAMPDSRISSLPPTDHNPALQSDRIHVHNSSTSRRERSDTWKTRKTQDGRSIRAPPSSSPARSKPSLDMIMQMRSRDSRRVPESDDSDDSEECNDVFQSRPMPSQASPQYRNEASKVAGSPSKRTSDNLPTSCPRRESSMATPSGSYYRSMDFTERLPVTPQGNYPKTSEGQSTVQPSTPSKSGSAKHYRNNYDASQPFLPPSSPIPSSPISSPAHHAHNIVSSPGPIDTDPPDQTDPELPFKLPPGPYSTEKPEISYAALIGRAIMASPSHSLRLKDIYDYISIVFPHYERRGNSHSQKWMNAIRQNLTNTPHFHKAERQIGNDDGMRGSFWHIRDEDVPCFANGGYNRHAADPNHRPSSGPRAEKRKRKNLEEQPRQPGKKAKLVPAMVPNPYHFPYAGTAPPPPGYPMPVHPYYYQPQQPDVIFPPLPPTHPNAHLIRPTHEATDVIFPPLPGYHNHAQADPSRQSKSESPLTDHSPTPPPASEASSSSISVPELSPNRGSSSPIETDDDVLPVTDAIYDQDSLSSELLEDNVTCELQNSVTSGEGLEPSIQLMDRVVTKGKGKVNDKAKTLVFPPPLPLPTTPTTGRNGTRQIKPSANIEESRSSTPPRPSTPTRKNPNTVFQLSPIRTPSSRKGLQMSPSRGQAHHKYNLRPPPDFASREEHGTDMDTENQGVINRTPQKRSTSGMEIATILPSTPKKYMSPSLNISPFRTPSRRVVFDPHDPGTLLDDELTRLGLLEQGSGLQESPVGFFGHGKGLLYESPSLPSPGQWRRPW